MIQDTQVSYQQLIGQLTEWKIRQNRKKVQVQGFHDVDDHGNIVWDEPVDFVRVSSHSDGGSYGARCIGENFQRWLSVHPAYINPDSALAGAWIGFIPGVGGWAPEDRPVHLYDMHRRYHIVGTGIGAANHLGPDMTIGLRLGWGGLLEKIRHFREFNHPAGADFYDGEEMLVLGMQNWIGRHVVRAREMAAVENDPFRKANLLEIAEINERLVNDAPRNLREACQFLAWFQSVDRMWGAGGALGQLDELLRPFYEVDVAAGEHDDEKAIWCIASLFINDTHYSQVGGPRPDGSDLTSPVSFLILEAVHRLKIPMNLAVRVHDQVDPVLMRKALENHLEDGTGVCFSLSGGLDKGFARNGFPIGLARMRAKVGCNWTALPGIEYALQDVTRQCITTPLLLALDDLVGEDRQPENMEVLWDRYVHHLTISVNLMKEGFDWHMERHARNRPEIVLNLFCHGPVERGLDVAAGGVDIVNIAVDGIGLAVCADSFAAIEQRVVVEKKLTWQELQQALKTDFEGNETVRRMLQASNRYGGGLNRADEWAVRIARTYSELVKGTPTKDGYNVIPGLFSHGDILMQGRDLGATPNGRKAGEAITHSTNPAPGFSHRGFAATAKANAVASTQPGYGNSAPLQLDVDSLLMEEAGGIDALEALIRTHDRMGGTLINLNVVSGEKILAAHANPELYPDLVVRVTGYSAFFNSLSPKYRQQIVDRFLGKG